MMITSISLTNFKSWSSSGPIRLAPLTVLFGTNSSGKSSLLQFLLMVKQTVQSVDRRRLLHTGDKEAIIDLGTYYDIIYNHKQELPLQFKVEWQPSSPLELNPVGEVGLLGDRISFSGDIIRNNDLLELSSFTYSLGLKDGDNVFQVSLSRHSTSSEKYNLNSSRFSLKRTQGRAWPLSHKNKFYSFPDETAVYYQNSDFLMDFELEFEKFFRGIHYVGPLRERPLKTYQWSGQTPEWVGQKGESAIEALLASKHRFINLKPKGRKRTIEELVASWLNKMGLIYSFRTEPIAKNRKEYDVLVKVNKGSPEVNLTDVGFGISQVLPVVAQSFYARPNSILIFEQPEIHLHPKVQSALADMFISAINARENAKKKNVQIIVESHSEHFLKRLQRRIAEKKIAVKDTALYFCRSTASGSKIEPLELDEFGNIRNWPKGFFGNEIDDIGARAEIEFKTRMERGE